MIKRLQVCFAKIPGWRDWLEAAVVLVILSFIILPTVAATNLLAFRYTAISFPNLLVLMAVTVVRPSLLEETLFRVLLLPERHESAGWWRWAIASWVGYVAAHPLIAWWLLPELQPIFFEPVFLGIVALLGAGCTLLRLRSGSIWTAVFIHWAVVVSWRLLLGGPSLGFGG